MIINICDNMHPHEVEIRIRDLFAANNYKHAESILIELKNYSGDYSHDQLSRICFAAITNEQIYNCYHCKAHLKILLKKHEDKIDEAQYKEVLGKIN